MRHVSAGISSRALCDAVSRPHESCRARERALDCLGPRSVRPAVHSQWPRTCCEWTGTTWRPSKHAAQLAPLEAVELIDNSSRSAIQRSCQAETSISIVSGVALCYCAFMDSRASRRVTTLLLRVVGVSRRHSGRQQPRDERRRPSTVRHVTLIYIRCTSLGR